MNYAIRVWKFDRWVFVGPVYPNKKMAKSWLPFVRSAWHGMKVEVISEAQHEKEKNEFMSMCGAIAKAEQERIDKQKVIGGAE